MKNIFVGNLSFGATEEAVRSMFEVYGTVGRVNIVTDRDSGQPRGFGFVEMSSQEEAQKAISTFHQKEFQGRPLTVNEARPREERPSHGSRDGGGYRGGGGGGGYRGGGGGRDNRREYRDRR